MLTLNRTTHIDRDYFHQAEDGMSLRDWFAGQALAELAHPDDSNDLKGIAARAYEIADAMIKEREKGG